jgi:hypothetical protein
MDSRLPMGSTFGGTYCAPMWAKFFAAALKDQTHPSFKDVAWSFGSWHGAMQGMSASASPSSSSSASPSPGPTQTIKPTVVPTPKPTTPKPTPTTPKPTPTAPKPTPTPTPSQRIGVSAAAAATVTPVAGDGSRGLVGEAAGWFAGLFGL